MDNKIIFSTREISVFIKIKTEDTGFDIMKYLDNNELKEKIYQEICEVLPVQLEIKCSDIANEKQILDAKDINYNQSDVNKYIYMNISYHYNFDVNKEYHKLTMEYLYEKIDKYVVRMINEKRNKEIKSLKEDIEGKNNKLASTNRSGKKRGKGKT